jgi:endonuclease/exonuclease/phosphatase family metal-dependent hydrolase
MNAKILFYLFLFLVLAACSSQKADPASTQDLIVASYNIRYNTPNDGENAWPERKEQVKGLIRYHEFDLFGTQEGLIGQLEDLGEMQEYAFTGVGRDDGQQAGEHSAIFYRTDRFELLDSGDFWLSETPDEPSYGWEAKHRRICSWAKFNDQLTGKTFFVFNAHFDHQAVEARRQSGILVVEKMKEIAGDAPILFLGDLNSTPDTEQIITIKTFLKDAYEVSEMPAYGPVGTFNSFDFHAPMERRIDYIFVSGHFSVQKYGVLTDSYDQKYPSDHQPVVAKVVID